MKALLERGIGCARALVLEGGKAVEAHLELPGLRPGDLWRVRLAEAKGPAGRVALGGGLAELAPLPPGATEGQLVTVEVVRAPVLEPGRTKSARVRAVEGGPGGDAEGVLLRAGPDLGERLAARGLEPVIAGPAGPDLLEEQGWSELLEEARTGIVPFLGGQLLIERTAAFLAVDVDGHLAAAELALAAAGALGAAVRRLDLTGSIVVDFPTPGSAVARKAVDAALEAALPAPFERTAMNGYGLVQIIRPRLRTGLFDLVQGELVRVAALELLRRAERAPGAGALVIEANPAVAGWLEQQPTLLAELRRRTGRAVDLRAGAEIPIWGGHVQ